MPIKRRRPKGRKTDLPLWQAEFMLSGHVPEEDGDLNPFEILEWKYHRAASRDPVKEAWSKYGEELLRDYIAMHAGCRPYAWWQYSAPEACRRRTGGTGSPKHDHLAYRPTYRFGIPELWITPREVEIYSGRARGIDGNPIHQPRRPFTGVAIDPRDPPRYESQATYLDRHGLLSTKERKALPVDAFDPETIITEDNKQ